MAALASRASYEKQLVFAIAVDVTAENAHLELLEATHEELEKALSKEIQAKENFQFHRERLHSLFMQAPALACVLRDPNHIFEFANEAYQRLFGSRDIIGHSLADVVPCIDPKIPKVLNDVYRTGGRFVGRNIEVAADWLGDGNIFVRMFDVIYEPVLSAERNTEGIWVWAIDVTEMHRLEREKRISERMASLGRLAAGVAHEINNPLAYALGNLELCISSNSLPLETRTRLEKSIDGIERVATIVKGLKTFSRIDDTSKEVIDLRSEIESAISIASHEIKLAQSDFEVHIENSAQVLAN